MLKTRKELQDREARQKEGFKELEAGEAELAEKYVTRSSAELSFLGVCLLRVVECDRREAQLLYPQEVKEAALSALYSQCYDESLLDDKIKEQHGLRKALEDKGEDQKRFEALEEQQRV